MFFTHEPILKDGVDGFFYGDQNGESRENTIKKLKEWLTVPPRASRGSTRTLLGIPKVGKTSTIYFTLQALESKPKIHSIYLSAKLQQDLQELKVHFLGELSPIVHEITSKPREELETYHRILAEIMEAPTIDKFLNLLPTLLRELRNLNFSEKVVLQIEQSENEVLQANIRTRIAHVCNEAGINLIWEQKPQMSSSALFSNRTSIAEDFWLAPLTDDEAAHLILAEHPKNLNHNGTQVEYPGYCQNRHKDFGLIRTKILEKVGCHPGSLQKLCILLEDVYQQSPTLKFEDQLDVAFKKKAMQDYLKTHLKEIEDLLEKESPEIFESLMQWINTYHKDETNLLRPHEGFLSELSKYGFAFKDGGIWTIPEYILKHYSLITKVKTLNDGYLKLLVAWVIFITLIESHHRCSEIQKAILPEIKKSISVIGARLSAIKPAIKAHGWSIKEPLYQQLSNLSEHFSVHQFEANSQTSITTLLSDTGIVGDDEALKRVYNEIGFFSDNNQVYSQKFGEKDDRTKIAPLIAQWAKDNDKLAELIESFHNHLPGAKIFNNQTI